jgi:uncharacterized membrane protein YgcG
VAVAAVAAVAVAVVVLVLTIQLTPSDARSLNQQPANEKIILKTMAIKLNNNQSTPILWTSLPDCHQELLSGGSPRRNGGGSGGGNSGGGGGGGTTGGIELPGNQPSPGNGLVASIATDLGSI